MTLTKTLMIFAAAGFLAACDTGTGGGMASGGGMANNGGIDASTIRDANLTGKLESAVMNGNTVVYSYFTDVISDGKVLEGADAYCGGPGQAVIQLTRGEKNGRGFNSMAFTCR